MPAQSIGVNSIASTVTSAGMRSAVCARYSRCTLDISPLGVRLRYPMRAFGETLGAIFRTCMLGHNRYGCLRNYLFWMRWQSADVSTQRDSVDWHVFGSFGRSFSRTKSGPGYALEWRAVKAGVNVAEQGTLAERKEALPRRLPRSVQPYQGRALFVCPSAHHLSLIEERPCLSLASLARV
jgi:hypothetical protein